jgi:hypothetical protein
LPADDYFLTAGESTFLTAGESILTGATAGESILTAGESILTTGESDFAATVSPLLQAVNTEATAIAKNTFFIFVCLIFKNYNFIFILIFKKGNPLVLLIFFFVLLGYKYSLNVLI